MCQFFCFMAQATFELFAWQTHTHGCTCLIQGHALTEQSKESKITITIQQNNSNFHYLPITKQIKKNFNKYFKTGQSRLQGWGSLLSIKHLPAPLLFNHLAQIFIETQRIQNNLNTYLPRPTERKLEQLSSVRFFTR